MATRPFATRTILSVTTGRLLTKSEGPKDNGIGDMYRLMGWMTGDSPFTHQLGRFAETCKPWLLRWFPEIDKAGSAKATELLDSFIRDDGAEKGIELWLASLALPETYDVPVIPAGNHIHVDPLEELVGMVGKERVLVVVPNDDDEPAFDPIALDC